MLFWKAAGQDQLGKVKEAHATWEKARAELLTAGARDFAGGLFEVEATDDALLGYTSEARQSAAKGLDLSHEQSVRAVAVVALAGAGDAAKSASLLAELKKEFPDNKYLQVVAGPLAEAGQLLQKNQPTEAIRALEPARPYELGTGPRSAGLGPNYLRGLAYLKLRDGEKAVTEFQRILDHRGVASFDVAYALAHLGLARAYALQGNNGKARTAYQDFFAAWKDADPDIPILKEAKTEYAKLQ